jgi:hypothetical protein
MRPQECIREMTEADLRDVAVHTFEGSVFVDSPETCFRVVVAGGPAVVMLEKN